jgi:hypothetical protein
MNEKIKQLAKQAGIIGQSETTVAPPVERFVELIVQECAELFSHTFTDEQYQRRIDKTIKKHFGVIQ